MAATHDVPVPDTSSLQESDAPVVLARVRSVLAKLPSRLQGQQAPSLGRVTPAAWRLLDVAAVIGPTFAVEEAAEVMGEPLGQVMPLLCDALASGVIVATGEGLAFRHELVRQAIYEGVPSPIRMALHRRIGDRDVELADAAVDAHADLPDATVGADSPHVAGADDTGPCQPATWPADSPEPVLDDAPDADPAPAPGPESVTVAVDPLAGVTTQVKALVAVGDLAGAADLARQALAGKRPNDGLAELHLELAYLSFLAGRLDQAVAHAEAVFRQASVGAAAGAGAEVMRLFGWMLEGQLTVAHRRAEALLGGAVGPGGDDALAGAFTTLAFIAWNEGRVSDTIGFLQAAVRRADDTPFPAGCPLPRFALAAVYLAVGDFRRACNLHMAGRVRVRRAAGAGWAAGPVILQARLSLATGRLGAAHDEAEAGLALARRHGTDLLAPPALLVLAFVALMRGDLGRAEAHLEQLDGTPPGGRALSGATSFLWARAQLAGARRGPEAGFGVMAAVYEDPATHRRLLVAEPAAAPWLVRTALAVGELAAAERIAACVERLAADNGPFSVVVGSGAHAQALLNRDAETLERLGTEHRHPWARAAACEDAGDLLAQGGHRCRGRAQLERALAANEQMGASYHAARVRIRLLELGSGQRRSRHSPRPVSGWASLTDAERRVTDLVAEGLSNPKVAERLFLSRHTVDFHLRQVFRKLNVGSRVELARLVLVRDAAA
jgi:DNA-binding CsgD family transcriptional regulator/tetratricopeptide (TPR) repeat protein